MPPVLTASALIVALPVLTAGAALTTALAVLTAAAAAVRAEVARVVTVLLGGARGGSRGGAVTIDMVAASVAAVVTSETELLTLFTTVLEEEEAVVTEREGEESIPKGINPPLARVTTLEIRLDNDLHNGTVFSATFMVSRIGTRIPVPLELSIETLAVDWSATSSSVDLSLAVMVTD